MFASWKHLQMLPLVSLLAITSFGAAYASSFLHDETLSVPGENPLQYCTDPSTYILDITYVDLSPNPPKAGEKLTVRASGNVTSTIVAGAHAMVSVKLRLNYGQIPIITREFDLCELLAEDEDIDEECPVKAGEIVTFTKEVEIPGRVPKGSKYAVLIDALPEEGMRKITCLQTEIQF